MADGGWRIVGRQMTVACAVVALVGAAAWGQIRLPENVFEPPATTSAGPVDPNGTGPVSVHSYWSADGVQPGNQIVLAVVFDIDERYHIQVRQPQLDWLIPTEVEVREASDGEARDGAKDSPSPNPSLEGRGVKKLPAGVIYGDIQWPEVHPIEVNFGEGLQTLDFYAGRATVFIKFSVGQQVEPGEHEFKVWTRYQACDDTSCLAPRQRELSVTLNVIGPEVPVSPQHGEIFTDYTGRGDAEESGLAFDIFGWSFSIDTNVLWLLWLVTAAGGFLLNFTPCVLPLVPIKIMGLSKAAGSPGRSVALGMAMFAGVVGFWLGMGAAIALVSGFDAVNKLFQYPAFTIGVGVVIFAMGLGMWGAFTPRLPQWVYRINPSQEKLHGSFGFGVMTAVLSTPCTAPFMGTAAAWATTQPTRITLATFAAIGVGMGAPYLVLAVFPQLVSKMPRTGPASELIKQVMGLLMLAAAAYFLGTGIGGLMVEPPDPPSRAYWWFVGAFTAAAGLWLTVRTVQITRSGARRAVFGGIGVVMIALGVWGGVRLTDRGPIEWVYYTPGRFEQALAEGKVVVMDFTAEWCLNCHALEQSQLHQRRVAEILNGEGVTPIKVDLTGNNEAGNAMLIKAGRRTIPLLVVFGPDGREVFKSDAYTAGQVLEAIKEAMSDL